MSNSTICHYLFGSEAPKVFEDTPHAYLRANPAFVNQCLDCCMQVHLFFLSHQQGFFLIDPNSGHNQCHLYSLKTAQIQRLYSRKTEEEKLARTEENRFLHLSLFLSCFFSDRNIYLKAIESALKKMGKNGPTPKKHFQAFVKDEGLCREKATRLALIKLFKEDLLQTFSSPQTPLYTELHAMALENLEISQDHYHGKKSKETVYTYPKIAGVAYLIDRMAKEEIAMVLKVKVLTDKGAGGVILQANKEIKANDPVLVFEAIATDGSYSLPNFKEEVRKCPSYAYHRSENKPHKKEESCFFCAKNSVDLTPLQKRIQTVMQSPENMLYALGADFVMTVQHSFRSFFTNHTNYPLLSNLFEEALVNRQTLGLASPNPEACSVIHVHFEQGQEALSERMALDRSPETFLKERGIL